MISVIEVHFSIWASRFLIGSVLQLRDASPGIRTLWRWRLEIMKHVIKVTRLGLLSKHDLSMLTRS